MAGLNLIGDCSLYTESVRTEETLTITGKISATLTRDSEDFTLGVKVHYSETLEYEASESFSREDFNGRDYYTFGKVPEPDRFWMVQTCCCKCRWDIILEKAINRFTSQFTKAKSDWTQTTTRTGQPPFTESGTYDAKAQFSSDWAQAVITTSGKTDRPPCKKASEGNLQGVNLAVTYTPNVLITQTEMDDAEETQTPTGISDKQSEDSPHFILEADYGYVKCEGMDMSLKGVWKGHGELSGPGGTTTEDISVTNTVTVKLE